MKVEILLREEDYTIGLVTLQFWIDNPSARRNGYQVIFSS